MFAQVDNERVVKTADKPPSHLEDGRTRSNAHLLPPDRWLEVVDPGEPDHDPVTEQVARGPIDVVDSVPTVTYIIEAKPEPAPEPVTPLSDDEITALRDLLKA